MRSRVGSEWRGEERKPGVTHLAKDIQSLPREKELRRSRSLRIETSLRMYTSPKEMFLHYCAVPTSAIAAHNEVQTESNAGQCTPTISITGRRLRLSSRLLREVKPKQSFMQP